MAPRRAWVSPSRRPPQRRGRARQSFVSWTPPLHGRNAMLDLSYNSTSRSEYGQRIRARRPLFRLGHDRSVRFPALTKSRGRIVMVRADEARLGAIRAAPPATDEGRPDDRDRSTAIVHR